MGLDSATLAMESSSDSSNGYSSELCDSDKEPSADLDKSDEESDSRCGSDSDCQSESVSSARSSGGQSPSSEVFSHGSKRKASATPTESSTASGTSVENNDSDSESVSDVESEETLQSSECSTDSTGGEPRASDKASSKQDICSSGAEEEEVGLFTI